MIERLLELNEVATTLGTLTHHFFVGTLARAMNLLQPPFHLLTFSYNWSLYLVGLQQCHTHFLKGIFLLTPILHIKKYSDFFAA